MIHDETIARVRELIAKRDEIDAELSMLIGTGNPHPLTVRGRVAQQKSTRKRKQSMCSVCGMPGHNVMTCRKGKGQHPNNPKVKDRPVRTTKVNTPDGATDAQKTNKIIELLQSGHDDDFVADVAHTSPRVVAFYRKQMRARGELT